MNILLQYTSLGSVVHIPQGNQYRKCSIWICTNFYMTNSSGFQRYINIVKIQTSFLVSYLAMVRMPGTQEQVSWTKNEAEERYRKSVTVHTQIFSWLATLSQKLSNEKHRDENACYQAAVEEYQRELQKEGKKSGVRPIAEKHGVNTRTLHRLANGGQSMSAFNASKQKLTPGEEHALVNFILASADRALNPKDPWNQRWQSWIMWKMRRRMRTVTSRKADRWLISASITGPSDRHTVSRTEMCD